ncbi:MAG: hypothetical protein JOZ68_01025 [Acidimicrobiia bacterium]|nr:hypothetical protein [Acidimicrobiia bacterium]
MRRAERERAARRRRALRWGGVLLVIVAIAVGIAVALSGGSSGSSPTRVHTDVATATVGGPTGPEGIPLQSGAVLAPETTSAAGQIVDGIHCNTTEQVAYHVHAHLSVYVNGQLRPIPPGIGIVQPVASQAANGPLYGASICYYWLHVHAQDGVIHIESPSIRRYTLGNFFDIWGQQLSTDQVDSASGPLTVFVDGRPYRGDPRAIPLESHEDIQIDVGNPAVPPQKVDWSGTSL